VELHVEGLQLLACLLLLLRIDFIRPSMANSARSSCVLYLQHNAAPLYVRPYKHCGCIYYTVRMIPKRAFFPVRERPWACSISIVVWVCTLLLHIIIYLLASQRFGLPAAWALTNRLDCSDRT
jgi:hypothetical protein